MPADQVLMSSPPPFVAVGGIGGSGTRLIAAFLAGFGVFIGHDLNPQLDNLAYTLLFKRRDVLDANADEIDRDLQLFATAMTRTRALTSAERERLQMLAAQPRPGHPVDWLQARADALIAPSAQLSLPPTQRWGWKEPNTHILLPALIRNYPQMRYIHVVRHGLDMAFSSNQGQLNFWADALLGYPGEPEPARALSYWCAVQKRARQWRETMGERFLWLDYDHLCQQPEDGLARLAGFLGLPCPDPAALLAMVRLPASMGRFRERDCSQFSAQDLATVAELGFALD